MKKILNLFAVLLLTTALFAQAPQKMSYQTVIRNASGVLINNTTVGIKVSVLQTSPVGTVVFAETHKPTTNANGLASLEIGGGTPVSGTIAGINWGAGPYYIKTETDPTGGTNYSITGTSQLLSVPYALYSANGGGGGGTGPTGATGPSGNDGAAGVTGNTGCLSEDGGRALRRRHHADQGNHPGAETLPAAEVAPLRRRGDQPAR